PHLRGISGHAAVAAHRARPRRGRRYPRVPQARGAHRPGHPRGGHRGVVVGFAGLLMRALIWITESSWPACVDQAQALLPADADVTLLHVAASHVEYLAGHPGPGRLGRHRPPPPGPPVREIAEAEAQALLERARERLGRDAQLIRCR